MPTFIGFNTIGQNKKFTAVDFDLIKIDLLNAFNIRQGELPGRPQYGTVMWDYVFENQITELQRNIETEVQRVCGGDPRIQVTQMAVFPQDNGFLIQLEIAVLPGTDAEFLSVFFDNQQRRASYV
jgi:phage baseplate assembly protein W